MEIKNQIAVITGGSSGLGKACAEMLAQFAAKVVILDQKTPDVSFKHEFITCDVTDEQAVENVFAKINNKFGVARILINCAGIAPASRIVDKKGAISIADFARVINVNLFGSVNTIKAFAENLIPSPCIETDNTRGVIINTSSVAATDGQIGQAAYSASKSAISGINLPIAREFAQFGIRIMAIAPGIMATPMLATMPYNVQTELQAQIPFPKRLGEPKEYAKLAKHIIENDYLNGTTIRLDAAIRMS